MTTYYLGIDVSKGYADFQLFNDRRQPMLTSFQLDDTHEGHQQLYQLLTTFLKEQPQARICAAVESTGGYENNWYGRLHRWQDSLPIQVARLNPEGVKAYARGCLQRTGTDAISAARIAEYLIVHPDKVDYSTTSDLHGLRKQIGLIRMLSKQQTQLSNQLESLIYTACPELLTFCKNGMSKWLLTLIQRYPTARHLAKVQVKTVAKIPYVTLKKAEQLKAMAKVSVATETDDTTAFVVKATAKQLAEMTCTISQLEKNLEEKCQLPEVELLKTIPGISSMTAITLILEIGDIHRFKSAKKLAAYFGLHPVYQQSGDKKGQVKMSKKGRKEPRRVLYMAAMNGCQTNPIIKDVHDKHVQRNMKPIASLGVCMHKLTRIVFGMLRNNKPFDPEIDRRYQQRSKEKRAEVTKPNPSRRFQNYDQKAPISSRQRKKRRELTQSHVVNVDHTCGIKESTPQSQYKNDNLNCQRTNLRSENSHKVISEMRQLLT
jgi:transposase